MSDTPPVLVYDGDCGFCTRSARLAAKLTAAVALVPWQAADLDALGATEERARHEVLLVDEARRIHGGAAAAAALLRRSSGAWPIAGLALSVPGVRAMAAWVYRRIADNRYRLPGATPACQLPRERWPG